MIIRSKAPLRIGLAGGGTDVSPYSDLYGGAVLNATVSLYAYAAIQPLNNKKIILNSIDKGKKIEFNSSKYLEIDGKLNLLKGVYNRIVKNFSKKSLSFELTTYVDAPSGSGLGTSSTLVVAIVGAFTEWLKLPLGEYDIANLAYEIERKDLKMEGGRQDQYAATFGGVNFMEFYADEKVIVNPLRIPQHYCSELENNLLLYYTGTSRISSEIIKKQTINVLANKSATMEATHKVKEQAIKMKEALLTGKLDEIGQILDFGWQAKKNMAEGITNPEIDEIHKTVMKAGASGAKISGAGGGGFMLIYCPGNIRHDVIKSLNKFKGRIRRYFFTRSGLTTWKI